MQAAPLQRKGNGHRDDQQAQAVAGGHEVGAGIFALGQQRHFRRRANGPREIAGGPHHRRRHAMHARRMNPVQPDTKQPAQHQRPHNAQRDGPPQAGHQRHHLWREIKPQRGANRPLASIAQRGPAFGGCATDGQQRGDQQRADHPGQRGVQCHTGGGGSPGQGQGDGHAGKKQRVTHTSPPVSSVHAPASCSAPMPLGHGRRRSLRSDF